jgi:hypothetical protein
MEAFTKTYEAQRNMRQSFFEEYKIHSLNYILSLFELINRIVNTKTKKDSQLISHEEFNSQIYMQKMDPADEDYEAIKIEIERSQAVALSRAKAKNAANKEGTMHDQNPE